MWSKRSPGDRGANEPKSPEREKRKDGRMGARAVIVEDHAREPRPRARSRPGGDRGRWVGAHRAGGLRPHPARTSAWRVIDIGLEQGSGVAWSPAGEGRAELGVLITPASRTRRSCGTPCIPAPGVRPQGGDPSRELWRRPRGRGRGELRDPHSQRCWATRVPRDVALLSPRERQVWLCSPGPEGPAGRRASAYLPGQRCAPRGERDEQARARTRRRDRHRPTPRLIEIPDSTY